jgi:hypothetical protein
MKYRITVYEDFALIDGMLTTDVLLLLIQLCKDEGFTYLTPNGCDGGFKLVRKCEH